PVRTEAEHTAFPRNHWLRWSSRRSERDRLGAAAALPDACERVKSSDTRTSFSEGCIMFRLPMMSLVLLLVIPPVASADEGAAVKELVKLGAQIKRDNKQERKPVVEADLSKCN